MTVDVDNLRVAVADLRKACDDLGYPFTQSDELRAGDRHLGQQRAVDAIRFGIDVERPGYNVYVLGQPGSHRRELVEDLCRERAARKPVPEDWCYVNNFSDPERPHALAFPAGKGAEFRHDMHALIEDMRLAIPAAFEGDDYRNQLGAIESDTQETVQEQWQSLEQMASREGIGVMQTPTGYVLAPVEDGKVIDDEDFEKLPEERQEQIKSAIQRLSEELKERIEAMPRIRKQHREKVRALNAQVTSNAVSALLVDLEAKYRDMPKVAAYLDEAEQHIIDNARDFRQQENPQLPFMSPDPAELFGQYEVNLVVDNGQQSAAPIVMEANPSYTNIIGKVEYRAEMGALLTDFRMVRAGALLRANGGYLVLDMHHVLTKPFVWEALKEALFAGHVRIESPGESYGLVATTTLKPEPIPLDAKVILIGERWLFYLLAVYDREFGDLFRVAADFEDDIERSDDNVGHFAQLVGSRAKTADLLPLDEPAMRAVIEQQAREADDGEKLSLDMRSLDDLLVQADFWARRRDALTIETQDIKRAVDERQHRLGRVRSRVMEAIQRELLLIDTAGAVTGQVNGLSVTDLGDMRFGHPVRITATTRMGTGKVVDIEREAKLGGNIHSKGVLILSSLLLSRFCPDTPLSLYASLVFEQSYGGVDGDSASVGEFCALLSSLAGIPLHQGIAVTGSLNQLGRVQVIGGVNEKIEGFFDVCNGRGLDGSHAVVIPRENVKHLMLRRDVVEAVEQDRFRIYAVRDVDEALTLLTGVEAGERDADGRFPEASVNARVEQRLMHYATQRKRFGETPGKHEREG